MLLRLPQEEGEIGDRFGRFPNRGVVPRACLEVIGKVGLLFFSKETFVTETRRLLSAIAAGSVIHTNMMNRATQRRAVCGAFFELVRQGGNLAVRGIVEGVAASTAWTTWTG